VLGEMPHHRLAHPPGADDADFFLVRHDARFLPLCGGMLGSRTDKTSRRSVAIAREGGRSSNHRYECDYWTPGGGMTG
jgi:hypothetical protein